MSNVPNEPYITAIVRADGTGDVSVDGEQSEVHAADVAGARAAVIARVAEEATSRDRPVRVETTDLDGIYALIVHPDGRVESEGPVAAHEDRRDVAADAESVLIPPPPFVLHGLIDVSASAPRSGTHVEPAPTRRSTFRAYGGVPEIPDASDDSGHGRHEVSAASGTVVPVAEETSVTVDSTPAVLADGDAVPTLEDFLQSRPSAPEGPARKGWQGVVHRVSGGLISPRPGKAEQSHRDAIRRVQRSLKGPRTIVVLNPKGGAHKTTATLLLAATFGIHRGGSTLAWDNNETRGTLGWRAQPSRHSNTAVDLLRDLGRFADVESARVGYLDNYVRGQGDAQFDVLASDEDAAASSTIDSHAFDSLHSTLSRFYRLLVIDTGNNMRASNWEAAVDAADQIVVVTTVNEETAASAAWLLDGLRQKGHQDKVSQAVTILSAPGDAVQPELSQRLHAHFAALTRVVLEVPYDPGFQSGGPLNVEVLSPQTREAWLQVTAAVADGL